MDDVTPGRQARTLAAIIPAGLAALALAGCSGAQDSGANATDQANVADLSESGFRVESHYAIPMGAQVWLTLPGLAAVPAIVAWSSGHSLGCRFETPLHPAVLDRVIAAGGA